MKLSLSFSVAAFLALATLTTRAADKTKALEPAVNAAVEAFKKTDPGMDDLFRKAAGYAVFPSVGKGGLVVGGAHGNGLVYEKNALVGRASLSQVTIGAQVGGQEFSQVIFFETADTLAKFKEGGFAMSAQLSAVAAAEGASRNAKYVDGVMVFTRAKQGLMAEASVGGQKFKFEPVEK